MRKLITLLCLVNTSAYCGIIHNEAKSTAVVYRVHAGHAAIGADSTVYGSGVTRVGICKLAIAEGSEAILATGNIELFDGVWMRDVLRESVLEAHPFDQVSANAIFRTVEGKVTQRLGVPGVTAWPQTEWTSFLVIFRDKKKNGAFVILKGRGSMVGSTFRFFEKSIETVEESQGALEWGIPLLKAGNTTETAALAAERLKLQSVQDPYSFVEQAIQGAIKFFPRQVGGEVESVGIYGLHAFWHDQGDYCPARGLGR
ncbi:hypothetical protein [Terriglobus roseus]|uniref:Uncharacterized protein n=1 Tax=Terriglobus roseus TaxID=392734 RepID=A0A1H4K6A6_9BACT|nr:hypothetical protein [Terriglobus roseus]SEB54064.1 hypothetical protein SAMN05443244_1031 [Terriglobus roseus]